MPDIMVLNGDIVWDGDDFAFVDGDDDIEQQAYLRSTADEGESVFYPSYGSEIFKYLGRATSAPVKSYIESAAREALLKVAGIDEVLTVYIKTVKNPEGAEDYYVMAKYRTENGQILTGKYVFNV